MSIDRGTTAMLTRRREKLAQGAEPIGWKIGFNVPEIREKLGLDRPLAGDLSSDSLIEDAATWSLDDAAVVVEPEVGVEIGGDGRSIAALILVNGEERHALTADHTAHALDDMVQAVADRLGAAGERLRPGERIITGASAIAASDSSVRTRFSVNRRAPTSVTGL